MQRGWSVLCLPFLGLLDKSRLTEIGYQQLSAAEKDSSVSRMVGEMLEEKMKRDTVRMSAKKSFFNRPVRSLRLEGEKLPAREDLHER